MRVFLAALVFVIFLSATAWSQSPYISSPVGSTYQPVSQTQRSLFRSPRRYDVAGNRVIEGNVSGGAHFRGNVPYGSVTSFQGSVPSADTLNSFIRYSAGSEDFSRGSGRYSQVKPYYNPSRTVTFTMPGQPGVFTPTSASTLRSIGGDAGGELIQAAQSGRRILGSAASASDIRSGPMSMSLQETERLISAEIGGGTGAEYGVSATEIVIPRIPREGQVDHRATDLKIKTVGEEGVQPRFGFAEQLYAEESAPKEDLAVKRIEHEQALEQIRERVREQMLAEGQAEPGETSAGTAAELGRAAGKYITGQEAIGGKDLEQEDFLETYTRVKQQIDNLQEVLKKLKSVKDAGEATSVESILEHGGTVGAEKVPENLDVRYPNIDTDLQAFRKNVERLAAESGQKNVLYDTDISAEANRILGGKSLAAYSEDRFNEYMEAAKVYQQQGRHYRAASAYTLASIYKPDEPLAYAGRSHALFAAGEYMSSALYLSRALELSPEYAKVKVDLLAILGTDDKEELDNRIAEIEQWYKRSDEADLKFLLAYIHYQAGEFDKAKEAIDTARTMRPDSSAVDALSKAIENK
jgi:tetratricopeptide (TPR) repeat protein